MTLPINKEYQRLHLIVADMLNSNIQKVQHKQNKERILVREILVVRIRVKEK